MGSVSILVVMESAQEAVGCWPAPVPEWVSILVVMESAQEVKGSINTCSSGNCFNPCCNGKCSGSFSFKPFRFVNRHVSILVVMESAQEA